MIKNEKNMKDDSSPSQIYFTIIPSNDDLPIETLSFEVDPLKSGDQIPIFLQESFHENNPTEDESTQKILSYPREVEVTTLRRLCLSDSSLNKDKNCVGGINADSNPCRYGIYAYSYTNFVISESSLSDTSTIHGSMSNIPSPNENTRRNIRATSLAMAVGLRHKRFYGDVYIGKLESITTTNTNTNTFTSPYHSMMKNTDLTKEDIIVCTFSPDIRNEVLNSLWNEKKSSSSLLYIPEWLKEGMKENYKDGESIVQLAKVMGLGEDRDIDSESDSESDSDSEDDDTDSHSNSTNGQDPNDTTPTSNITVTEKTNELHKSIFDSTLCIHCRGPTSTLCPNCEGVYFCPPPRTCQQQGWSHQCLCATWKIYTNRRKELSTFPFTWHHPLLSSSNFTSEQPYKSFLQQYGLYNQGWWKTELGGWWSFTQPQTNYQRDNDGHDCNIDIAHTNNSTSSSSTINLLHPNVRQSYASGFSAALHPSQFPPEHKLTTEQIQQQQQQQQLIIDSNTNLIQLHSWEAYYKLRNIPLSSPVALLLTFPLTMYYAIQQYGTVPLIVSKMLRRPMRIHIVGIEKELNFLDIFQEVGFLLPSDIQLELIFVIRKDMLPSQFNNNNNNNNNNNYYYKTQHNHEDDIIDDDDICISFQSVTNIQLRLVKGTYGSGNTADLDPNFDCGSGPPDMILGMNAGIYAYESWRSVVQYLDHHPNVVGVFTDYNEHSAVNCAATLAGHKSRQSVCVNPFRQPRALPVRCMNLPQFSNGFIYTCNEQEIDQ